MKKEKKQKIEYEMLSFRCPVELLKRLDDMTKKSEISRSRFLLNICENAVETLETCEKVGLLQIGFLLRDMQEYLVDWSKDMKNKRKFSIDK